ncbi:MAG: DUF2470 domain-containing protein [Pelistega sp.]|nr:DUF2470 domain-containing protein [Pelistega sp.]
MLHTATTPAPSTTTEFINDGNLSRFDSYTTEQGLADALSIYQSSFAGDLATIVRPGRELEGYPMGSVVPFMLDHTGSPVILTANIAEHTKNAKKNSRASLLVRDVARNYAIETSWRLTIMGDLELVPDEDYERVSLRYNRFYPHANGYKKVHDFIFMRLAPKKLRLIKTFGQIKWLDVETIAVPTPFTQEQEEQIITHMNEDHQSAIAHYLQALGMTIEHERSMMMVGVNQFGATLRHGLRLVHLPFTQVVTSVNDVRMQLIALAKR